MDRRGLAREPDRSPAPTGVATGAESQGGLEAETDERNAESRWLMSVGSYLRSFLGIAALLVLVLPAVVLVLTLLADDNKPVSMKTPTARGGGSAVTHQSQSDGGERSGEGEVGDRPSGRRDVSSGTSSEDEVVGPTWQTEQDHRDAHQAQDAPVTVAAVPATPTASAAGSPEPVSSVAASSTPTAESADGSSETPTTPILSVPPDTSTAPTTETQPTSVPAESAPAESAPPIAQQASSLDPSAPATSRATSTPGEASADDFQEVVPDANTYDPSEYAGGSLR